MGGLEAGHGNRALDLESTAYEDAGVDGNAAGGDVVQTRNENFTWCFRPRWSFFNFPRASRGTASERDEGH
jgi:hypothetical protein